MDNAYYPGGPSLPSSFTQRSDSSKEAAGQRLRRARERLNLAAREVEQASQLIVERHGRLEFEVLMSRLSGIENRGTLPSLYRMYSLCCIYRLDLNEVLEWYGVPVKAREPGADVEQIKKINSTHLNPQARTEAKVLTGLDRGIDLPHTFFVGELVQRARGEKLPTTLPRASDGCRFRYGFVGTKDFGMCPLISPGTLLIVDHTKRRIQTSGWRNLSERPIYFLEHRDGYYCRWCSVKGGVISLISHPSSESPILNFCFPGEIEVVGKVIGHAVSLNSGKARRR